MGVQAMTFCFSPYLGFQMGRSWVLPPHLQKDTTEEVRKPVFQTLMLSARENQLSLEERALLQERMEADLSGFNIDAPRWDQCTFLGRVKHFFNVTDPRTVLVPERKLDWAKVMVEKSRMGTVPPGTQVEQLLYAKKLYDSAFHPDTGDKMNVIGRMSFQVPGGMIITGFMLQFYRTIPAVVFWQWVNQSFNALVNYTNRNAASPTSVRQMAVSYVTATTTAVATAVGMNTLTKVPSGVAVGMVATRRQQSPRENFFFYQAGTVSGLDELGLARAQSSSGKFSRAAPIWSFSGL
ncbi:sideroflexin-2 isoform X3 [Monodon monoceros]|uniref:sideroflexin-2 isoform X3 n=1 Tax=Monodon monoceros TaxID=40151 RepID=UPI0010F8AA70|nr:sideroflexin-2 isoform X3 [Monodon monoceros]